MPTLADVLRQTGYAQDGTLATPTPTESPMTKVLAEHIKSIPQKFNENQAYQMELLGKAFPGNTYESMMTQGDPKAMAELAMQTPFNAMIAYHGTPHKILGGFDISKVGTGEGAQAYGHGMYFAEAPDVAKTYADKLGYDYKYMGKTPKEDSPTDLALRWLKNLDWDKEAAKAQWKNEGLGAKVIQAIDKINLEKVQKPGNLYKVDIPDEYIPMMLDYDKPIKEQPEILNKIRTLIKDPDILQTFDRNVESGITGANVYANYIPTGVNKFDLLKQRDDLLKKYMTKDMGMSDAVKSMNAEDRIAFSEIAQKIDDLKNKPKIVSQVLNEAGIKGIKYLDQGSRGKGGTSNFVVFDPSTVKILEENGKPLTRKELIEKQVKELKD